jgi:hypothetical protein
LWHRAFFPLSHVCLAKRGRSGTRVAEASTLLEPA